MFGIIDKYVGRTVLSVIILCTFVLTLIAGIITFLDMTRHIGKGDIDFLFLVWYVILLLPDKLVMLFPVAVLLGGVLGLGILSKNSELIVMLACGMSKTNIILSSLKSIFPMIIVVSLFAQLLLPQLNQYAETTFNKSASQGRVSLSTEGVWLREGNYFIYISRILSDSSIEYVARYEFVDMKLVGLANARSGVFDKEKGVWDMKNVKSLTFDGSKVTRDYKDTDTWKMYLTPELLTVFNYKGTELSAFELYKYISYLEENNLDSSRYRVEFYKKFSLPFALVVMLLLGASTIFGSSRSVSVSARVLVGLCVGFLFYMTSEIFPNFAVVSGLPPFLGVSLPIIIFASLALYILGRRM